jgi:hypothetical protein
VQWQCRAASSEHAACLTTICVLLQHPAGSLPEQQLLVACGLAPRGKLAVVRSGCGLQPTMLDGPELPVSMHTSKNSP